MIFEGLEGVDEKAVRFQDQLASLVDLIAMQAADGVGR